MEPKQTYPSSSQVTRPNPPIQDLPAYAVVGYGFGMVYGALPPLMKRAEGWKVAARNNALQWGPRMTAWWGLYCLFCNTLPYLRKKEDDWNGIIAFGLGAGTAYSHRGIIGATQAMIFSGATHAMVHKALHKIKEAESIENDS